MWGTLQLHPTANLLSFVGQDITRSYISQTIPNEGFPDLVIAVPSTCFKKPTPSVLHFMTGKFCIPNLALYSR